MARFTPITREVFGPDGKGTISGEVEIAVRNLKGLDEFVGNVLTDGQTLWTHPVLLPRGNDLRRSMWYRLTLERGKVVMRQDKDRTSVGTDDRVFRAPPLRLATVPADALVTLVERLAEQGGLCEHPQCLDRTHGFPIGWRDGVLIMDGRYGKRGGVVCGACYDALAAKDAGLRDERAVFDGRRLFPHAVLQLLALPG
jgi:hypothetical protein